MIKLDHFVWFPVEGSGYQDSASGSSKKVNPEHFKSWFKEFLPVLLSDRKPEAHLIFNRSESPFLLLTRLGYTEDEIGRDAPMHHSAVVHKKLLKSGKLSLFDVQKSLRKYDEEKPKAEGELERLKVPQKEGQDFAHAEEIKTLLTPAAVKSLTYRLLKDKKNRIIVRCGGSEEMDRFKIKSYLVNLLSIDLDIRAISATTMQPRDRYCNLFDVAVTEKTFTPPRHSEDWSYVEWDMDEFKKGKPKNEKLREIFERIDQDFLHDIGEYLEEEDKKDLEDKKKRKEEPIEKDKGRGSTSKKDGTQEGDKSKSKSLPEEKEGDESKSKSLPEGKEGDESKSESLPEGKEGDKSKSESLPEGKEGDESKSESLPEGKEEDISSVEKRVEKKLESSEIEKPEDVKEKSIEDEPEQKTIEDLEDGKEKARALLSEAKREYDTIDFNGVEEYIEGPNFDFEIFKVKFRNLKEKGEGINRERKKEKLLERLEEAEEKNKIVHEDYVEIKDEVGEKEDLSSFEERLKEAEKRKKLYLLIEEISKGFDVPDDIREKVIRQGKKNIEVPTGELSAEEIKEEVEEIKAKIESYYRSLDEEEEKDKINNVDDLVLDYCPVDFGDVAGMSELKQRVSMAVESPIEDYEVILESTGSPPENSGILLYGAPGVGKTFMARAAAGEYQLEYELKIVDVPMEAIYGLHWSKQVERIVDIFQLSEEKSPSMVIWDEFDSYAADPKLTGRKYDEKKTTTFKQKFEGMTESENMVVHIATSNYPWKLELPLIRPGRLGEIIFVPPPDKIAREEILKLLVSDAKMEGMDFEKLAEKTKDATISNLKNIVKEATQKPVKEWRENGRKGKPRPCSMEDFLWAVERENLSQYKSWVKEAKRELEKPKVKSKADLFPEILDEYDRLVD